MATPKINEEAKKWFTCTETHETDEQYENCGIIRFLHYDSNTNKFFIKILQNIIDKNR